uniref:Discoidin-2 n=1 Tax=Magallana gigas TaxID=29159 RepID=K1QFH8_MAGGI
MKTDFEDFKNRTATEIQQLRDRNSFLASVQSTNVQTLNMLMTDVFKIRAKLGFITMDSVQQNSSLDIVLDAIQRLDKLNTTVGGQRGNQYIRKCHNPNWDVARCSNITVHVNFSPAFDEVPYVMLGVSKVDAGSGHNTRFQAFTSAITEQGFDYTIGTWGDSQLWGSTFEWLACPY